MLRRIGRLLLGAAFITSGVEAIRDVDRRAAVAESLGVPEPVQTTRILAGVQMGAGFLLVINRFPRLSALLLAVAAVPSAATGHAFWTEKDVDEKSAQRNLFIRDLGLIGGALVATVDTGGRESVPHRAARVSGKAAKKAAKQAGHLTP